MPRSGKHRRGIVMSDGESDEEPNKRQSAGPPSAAAACEQCGGTPCYCLRMLRAHNVPESEWTEDQLATREEEEEEEAVLSEGEEGSDDGRRGRGGKRRGGKRARRRQRGGGELHQRRGRRRERERGGRWGWGGLGLPRLQRCLPWRPRVEGDARLLCGRQWGAAGLRGPPGLPHAQGRVAQPAVGLHPDQARAAGLLRQVRRGGARAHHQRGASAHRAPHPLRQAVRVERAPQDGGLRANPRRRHVGDLPGKALPAALCARRRVHSQAPVPRLRVARPHQ